MYFSKGKCNCPPGFALPFCQLKAIDGGLSDWSAWSKCSSKCNGGEQKRNRTCSNPEPAHGGKDCEGELTESKKCNEQPCRK